MVTVSEKYGTDVPQGWLRLPEGTMTKSSDMVFCCGQWWTLGMSPIEEVFEVEEDGPRIIRRIPLPEGWQRLPLGFVVHKGDMYLKGGVWVAFTENPDVSSWLIIRKGLL